MGSGEKDDRPERSVPPVVCSTVIEDPAEQAALQPWVEMECVQLGRGKQVGRMEVAHLGKQQIVREHQEVAVQKVGVTPANLCTVSCCTPDPAFRFSELGAGNGAGVYFMPEKREYDIYAPPGVITTYITFDQEVFLDHARSIAPGGWERAPEDVVRIPAAEPAVLAEVLGRWMATARLARDERGIRRAMTAEILDAVCTSSPVGAVSGGLRRAYHTCRVALRYVEGRLVEDTPPSIGEICRHAGVSERGLQYAFRTYTDMSPLAYLRVCRLNRVRAGLLHPAGNGTTVTEVAIRYHFFHLGKFARDYRLHFGEAPSATLARGLGRGG